MIKCKMYSKTEFLKMKYFYLNLNFDILFIFFLLFFVVIWLKYQCLKSDKRFENYPKCAENGH